MAPADKRGTLGSVNQLVICFGILGALVVNVILPATDWRTMFYLAAIPPALVILGEALLVLASSHLCKPSQAALDGWLQTLRGGSVWLEHQLRQCKPMISKVVQCSDCMLKAALGSWRLACCSQQADLQLVQHQKVPVNLPF